MSEEYRLAVITIAEKYRKLGYNWLDCLRKAEADLRLPYFIKKFC